MTGVKSKPVSLFVYFTLWCLYNLQGPLYPAGSIISKLLLVILLVWSFVIMLKVNMHERNMPRFFTALNVFLLVTTIYGAILIMSGQDLYITEGIYIKAANTDYLKQIYISLLPIFVLFYYSRKGNVTIQHVFTFIIILLLINIIGFFYTRTQSILYAAYGSRNADGFTLNIGYKFLALFPLILIYERKRFLQYVLVMLALVFVILSMKRGAILIGAVSFILFLLFTLKSTSGNKRKIVAFMSLLALIATVYIVNHLLVTNDYFVSRIEQTFEGDSSNRGELFSTFLNHFISEQNFMSFIFGNGANATLKIGMNYAHNDWLELAINNGVIGLLLYVWYYIALFIDYRKIKKVNRSYANVMMMTIFILFATSLFSMSYASVDIAMAIALGFILAQVYKTKDENSMLYR